MSSEAPIGVFDSGIGGLTVVREMMRQMPDERIVYFGDTARVPYGNKSKSTVIRYSRQIVKFLKKQRVKAIVVACNTASALALPEVTMSTDVPVLGVIEPAVRMAVDSTKNGRIGVIATTGTIESGIYEDYLQRVNPRYQVYGKACPLFVPLVEEGLTHDSITEEMAGRYLKDLQYKDIDTLILGCTHYPLLRTLLRKVVGPQVNLVNPAYETAIELKDLLTRMDLDCRECHKDQSLDDLMSEGRKYDFYVSDAAEKFQQFACSILPYDIEPTVQINIEEF